jgi:hypothetical protein
MQRRFALDHSNHPSNPKPTTFRFVAHRKFLKLLKSFEKLTKVNWVLQLVACRTLALSTYAASPIISQTLSVTVFDFVAHRRPEDLKFLK